MSSTATTTSTPTAASTPTIYFIDDSATMREVIKIAFRRENINVVACHDATQALTEIENTPPDIVITDVIMPEKDGYEVCQYIKSHPQLARIPVVLMSGVVNRAVAEKAFAVHADELLRKPFQPQDLIARVKHLLKPNGTPAPTPAAAASAAVALSSIFSAAAPAPRSAPAAVPSRPVAPPPVPTTSAAAFFPVSPGVSVLEPVAAPAPVATPAPVAAPAPAAGPAPAAAHAPAGQTKPAAPPTPKVAATASQSGNQDIAKLKVEVARLEGLVKKLQVELQAEREYARTLEAHVKTLQEGER
ncbi:MAG TPA: response regulator [Candidatus Angelobacter sp.]|nr:response regulator [Candidatus Angelobacter sp.]